MMLLSWSAGDVYHLHYELLYMDATNITHYSFTLLRCGYININTGCRREYEIKKTAFYTCLLVQTRFFFCSFYTQFTHEKLTFNVLRPNIPYYLFSKDKWSKELTQHIIGDFDSETC